MCKYLLRLSTIFILEPCFSLLRVSNSAVVGYLPLPVEECCESVRKKIATPNSIRWFHNGCISI